MRFSLLLIAVVAVVVAFVFICQPRSVYRINHFYLKVRHSNFLSAYPRQHFLQSDRWLCARVPVCVCMDVCVCVAVCVDSPVTVTSAHCSLTRRSPVYYCCCLCSNANKADRIILEENRQQIREKIYIYIRIRRPDACVLLCGILLLDFHPSSLPVGDCQHYLSRAFRQPLTVCASSWRAFTHKHTHTPIAHTHTRAHPTNTRFSLVVSDE